MRYQIPADVRQLSQALNDRESELSGRSTIQTYSLLASHQEATANETPDYPVPDQFEVSDFLPDDDCLLAPLGNTAAVPDNDALRFVLVKWKTGSISSPWSIPDRAEFDKLVNEATQLALSSDCLAPSLGLIPNEAILLSTPQADSPLNISGK